MSKTSLATRFNWLVFVFYLGSLAIAAPLAYVVSRGQAYDAASDQLRLLVNMVKAVRAYVADDVRPPLLKANFFPYTCDFQHGRNCLGCTPLPR